MWKPSIASDRIIALCIFWCYCIQTSYVPSQPMNWTVTLSHSTPRNDNPFCQRNLTELQSRIWTKSILFKNYLTFTSAHSELNILNYISLYSLNPMLVWHTHAFDSKTIVNFEMILQIRRIHSSTSPTKCIKYSLICMKIN